MDKRRHYILVLDTETANTIEEIYTKKDGSEGQRLIMDYALVYDIGYAVTDTHGNIYETGSYINKDIFYSMQDIMASAYYAWKIPMYEAGIASGERKLTTTIGMKRIIARVINKWGIKEVCAHNSRFDLNATNVTLRYITKSASRYFFPYGVTIWDSMKMAEDTIAKQKSYIRFCEEHNFLSKRYRRPSLTAEALYAYITHNPDFKESHTALEDVLIETQIVAACYKQHKSMRKKLYGEAKR